MTVAVASADTPVPTMDQQFALLIPGDFPRPLNRRRLSVVNRGGPVVPLAANGPSVPMRDDMLVFAHLISLRLILANAS
jgi:hypothetical protein